MFVSAQLARAALISLSAALLICSAGAAECSTGEIQSLNDEVKLHTDILCNYHSEIRPVKDHKSAITVKVALALKYISFDSSEEIFTIHGWVTMFWQDEFLKWTPSNYGSIKEIYMESHEIWTPHLTLFNRDASLYPSDSFYTTCLVNFEGKVTCVPQILHSGLCRTSLRRWPYDIHNCTFFYGAAWMHTGEEVNYTFYDEEKIVVLDEYKNGPGWNLINVITDRQPRLIDNSTYPSLQYTFMLKREAAGPAAIVVVPSIAIVTLTLLSLLLDVKDNTRLTLACFSLFGHFRFLIEIGYDIPKHSSDTPIILLFLRDSMFMTLLAILVTLLLMWMRRRAVPAPAWVVGVTRLATSGPGKYVVFTEFDPSDGGDDTKRLADDGEDTSHATKEGSRLAAEWLQFANLLNSCIFIISVLIYSVLICVYIPYDK